MAADAYDAPQRENLNFHSLIIQRTSNYNFNLSVDEATVKTVL